MADIILAVLIFAPAVITFLLRSNAAMSFMTLSASFVLITLGSADLKDLSGHLDLHVDSSTLNLILLIVPLLLTLLLTRKAFSGQMKMALYLLTSLCTGGLLALLSVPLLNATSRADFANNWGWTNLQKIQTPIIAAGLILSLFLIWFGGFKRHSKHHK